LNEKEADMSSRAAEVRAMVAVALLAAVTGTIILCTPASAEDTRAYCAKVDNDDRVQPLPGDLVPNARRMFDLSAETPDSYIKASTRIRCADGAVWLCSYGANLACDKADVSRNSRGADGFCKENPDSIDVPMAATGHATVYEWKCVGRKARIVRQSTEVDARGFIAENWKRLE
jgi:hypothetical protein